MTEDFDAERPAQLKQLLGDRYQTILKNFLANTAQYLATIGNALDAGDLEAARKTSHKMKSSSAQFGLLALQKLAADLEYSEDLDKAAMAALYTAMEPAYGKARTWLESRP